MSSHLSSVSGLDVDGDHTISVEDGRDWLAAPTTPHAIATNSHASCSLIRSPSLAHWFALSTHLLNLAYAFAPVLIASFTR